MTGALLVIVLAGIALALVLIPLRTGPRHARPDRDSLAVEAMDRKDAALTAILDLEAEQQIGKLSEPDFDALRDEYESQAVLALRELDALGGRASDDELEAEIAELRAHMTCPNCGAARVPDRACRQCGE